jgi:hypothetical protein
MKFETPTSPSFQKWFGDKAHQVEPGAMTAFGISVRSRYSKAAELVDMIQFAQLAAKHGLADFVDAVEWDSKACHGVVFVKTGSIRKDSSEWAALTRLVDVTFNEDSESAELRESDVA